MTTLPPDTEPIAPALPRWRQLLTVLVFALLVLLPPSDMALDLDPSPPLQEKRDKVTWPGSPQGLTELRAWPQAVGKYLDDHFGFRDSLVRWNSRLDLLTGKVDVDSVVYAGTEDWLYFHHSVPLAQRGERGGFPPGEREEWVARLGGVRDWLASQDIAFLVVVVPNKSTVYPRHLPRWVTQSLGATRADAFLAAMGEAEVETLDLRPRLLAAPPGPPLLYEKTDSHWTEAGALHGAAGIAERLRQMGFEAVPAIDPKAFPVTYEEGNGGDLAQMIGLEHSRRERRPRIDPSPLGPATPAEPPEFQFPEGQGFLVHPFTGTPGRPHVVMFRDSFSMALIPYLSRLFSRSVFVWHLEVLRDLVAYEKPEVVIFEVVERFLDRRRWEAQIGIPPYYAPPEGWAPPATP